MYCKQMPDNAECKEKSLTQFLANYPLVGHVINFVRMIDVKTIFAKLDLLMIVRQLQIHRDLPELRAMFAKERL